MRASEAPSRRRRLSESPANRTKTSRSSIGSDENIPPPEPHKWSGKTNNTLDGHIQSLFKEHRGIEKLYDWQTDCLSTAALRDGRNLILSLPTSSGKTLVAEVLMLQQAIQNRKDTILILPFVSIVQEKIKSLIPFGLELDLLIEEYASNKGRIPPIKRRKKNSIYVATIEKAQSLVNALIQRKMLDSIGLVIVDELHMLGEGGSRGACLEQTLAKLIFAAPSCQLVGMSATLSNIEDLQKFLNADLFCCDFRPVKLTEFAKIGNFLYRIDNSKSQPDQVLKFERKLGNRSNGQQDPDNVVELVTEVIPTGSCLVFCSTKKNAENLVLTLAKTLPKELKQRKIPEKRALLAALKDECDGRLCSIIARCIPYGLAYHHSGLTAEERKLIQDAYLEGTLCLLCCTSTLAAGVNLPAKRVIVRSPLIGNRPLTLQEYKQMTGRAGRAGLDTTGESVTILQNTNQAQFLQLICAGFSRCESSLLHEGAKGLRSLILSLAALELVTTISEAQKFLTSTLLSVQGYLDNSVVTSCINDLLSSTLIQLSSEGQLSVTPLGRGCFAGCIDVAIAKRLKEDLMRPLQSGIVLSTPLHLIYAVLPYDVNEVLPDWNLMHSEYCSLKADEKRVFELEGVTEAELVCRISGNYAKSDPKTPTLTRLYLALLLHRLWKEQRVWDVAAEFGQPRGWVQGFLQTSASFASAVTRFCEHIPELWPYTSLLPDFVKRLSHCVQMELLPLMDIQGVKLGRARQLYAQGYRTLHSVAQADPLTLVQQIDNLSKKQATQIVASAKMLLQEELASKMDEVAELLSADQQSDSAFVEALVGAVN